MGEQASSISYVKDEEKTRANVKQFFKKEYPEAKRLARHGHDWNSASVVDGTVQSSNEHDTETRLISGIDAKKILTETDAAIESCSKDSQPILQIWGVDGNVDNDRYCIGRFPYSERKYYYLKKEALVEFAEAYTLSNLLALKKVFN